MKIVIVAGPNGAGKTTFARFFLGSMPEISHYLNADTIAAGLAPLKPEAAAVEAGRFLLTQMDQLVGQKINFAFETTLSSKNYLRRIRIWKSCGYDVRLVFLSLPSQDFAINRVKQRVKQGGHNIPEKVIRRRFNRGLENLDAYKKIVTTWQVFDNSVTPPILIESSDVQNEKRKK
ncbi:zeta toxin family protein [Leptospira levettii]|uniref:Zeta toxin family protein n=1 Tax=Leptospira levettii TaxID=2023178 RepID=A0AAW5UYB2_9LEPT|nr:zeta toxin family protein [Leptospira levettii]MCW7465042.1 zeta toxin family protein [Leptospira levettii]MCW7509782.1 zeta toxin family protein [Leptospira levettii]MCW7513532.1 zeta toxin family protein [Leptospira levettii]